MWIVRYILLWFWAITPTYGDQVSILEHVTQAKSDQSSICVPSFTDKLKTFFDPESAKPGSEKLRLCSSAHLSDEAYKHLDYTYGSGMVDNIYREIQLASDDIISAKSLSESRYSDSLSEEGFSTTQVRGHNKSPVEVIRGYQNVTAE